MRALLLFLVSCGASVAPAADAAADVVAADAATCTSANALPSRDSECPAAARFHAFSCDLGGCVDESARGLWCCR